MKRNLIVVLVTNWAENSARVLELETTLASKGMLPMGTWSSPGGNVFYRVEALRKDITHDDVSLVFTGLGFTLSGGAK